MGFERRFGGFGGQNAVATGLSQKPSFLRETMHMRRLIPTAFRPQSARCIMGPSINAAERSYSSPKNTKNVFQVSNFFSSARIRRQSPYAMKLSTPQTYSYL